MNQDDENKLSRLKHGCPTCEGIYPFAHLDPISDLLARLQPGDIVPSGQCPNARCRSLCYPLQTRFKAQRYADLWLGHLCQADRDILEAMIEQADTSAGVTGYPEGFLLWFLLEDFAEDEWGYQQHHEWLDLGLSEDLWRLRERCAREGFQGIVFNEDGGQHPDELAVYDEEEE